MPSGWLWQVFAQPEVDESEMSFGWRRRWGRRQYAHFIRSGGRGGCRIPTQVKRFVQHRAGRHVEDFDSAAGQSLLLVMAPAFQDGAEFASARRGQTDFSQLEQIVHLFGNRVPGSSDVVVNDDWRDASRLWPAGWLELGFGSLARRQRERRIRFADPPARLDVMALLVFGHSDAALLFIALRREQCLIFCQNQKETTKKESTNWVTATQTIHCWQKSAFRKSRRKGGFISVAVTTCWTNCCLTLRVRVCWTPARGSVPARQPFAKFTSARLVNYIANYFSFSFLFFLSSVGPVFLGRLMFLFALDIEGVCELQTRSTTLRLEKKFYFWGRRACVCVPGSTSSAHLPLSPLLPSARVRNCWSHWEWRDPFSHCYYSIIPQSPFPIVIGITFSSKWKCTQNDALKVHQSGDAEKSFNQRDTQSVCSLFFVLFL